jgi:hypothetical protein
LGSSQRFGKDGLSKYLCMYMPAVVSNGRSVRILYPGEYYDSWADPKGLVRTMCQINTWYLVRILYPREYSDSWVDLEGPIRTVCQSTTNVVDAPTSFYCHMLMMLFQLCVVDDVVVPTSCH